MTRRPRVTRARAVASENLSKRQEGVKQAGCGADTIDVTFERCPYDTHPISAEAFSGGSLMLTCECCGAAWEAHNSWLRRIIEPDWDAVRAARAGAGLTADGNEVKTDATA